MGPTRKKSVNKRLLSEVSPDKEVRNSTKNNQRVTGKRKFSDQLGPQWTKGELQRFYRAYRDFGEDWKKVAAEVRNRSVEMVEALYNMNRAYLSLPEGTASVLGLIAMMTDHYSVLEANDSERESNDVPGMSSKPQKRKRAKIHRSTSKDLLQSRHPVLSTDGCLSLLKKGKFDGGQPRAVGKRTPRFPVSHKKDGGESYVISKNKVRKQMFDATGDDMAHVTALTLTEASKKGGSPLVSQPPLRMRERIKSSPGQSWDRMVLQSESALAKLHDASIYEGWLEGDIGSRRADVGRNSRDTRSLVEGVGTVEVHHKGKKFYGKKVKVEEIRSSQSDDGEACSGTEEGQKVSDLRGKIDIEASNAIIDETSPHGRRRRGKKKKFISGDEFSALDALQTLAHLSVMESESSVQCNEERDTLDVEDKSSAPEATSTSPNTDKIMLPVQKEKPLYASSGVDSMTRKSKVGRNSTINAKPVSEAKHEPQSNNNMLKRKHHSLVSKVSNAKSSLDSHIRKPLETKALDEEINISVVKGKRTAQISTLKQLKSVVEPESSSVSGDQKNAASDLATSAVQVAVASQVILSCRTRSRKMDPKRVFIPEEGKSSENTLKTQANKYSISLQDRALYLKETLSSCLSSHMVRRWCTFEWLYSAIDYPWFAKREFVEYLNHVGLGHVPRLTRIEWGVIRSSLGKPRRFSERFLHEEREKLKQYRESVRKHYTELHSGVRQGLPTDLARPLSVGQQVIALHPKSRELHGGRVLTVDHDRNRVQFDCPEMGVEFVKDIDCMPLDPLENMPEALKRERFSATSKELLVNGHSNIGGFDSSGHNMPGPMNTLVTQTQVDANRAILQNKASAISVVNTQVACGQPSAVAQIQAKEVDIQALSELRGALDKKEVWLMELKNLNNDILENQNNGDNSLKDSDPLKKHLATVLVQLKEASGQVSSALQNLRQRNTYPGNTQPPWLNPAHSSFSGGLPSSHDSFFVSQESGSTAVEIVRGSRQKAHAMVDAAVQAISSLKEGEDAFVSIGEAIDSMDKLQLASELRVQVTGSPHHVNGNLHNHNQFIHSKSEPQVNSNACGSKSLDSDKIEAAIPSELITSCVATLLMIQTCTERQYPPADVAQIIDSAVTSLHPCCPQNLPIYREIQMCMGRIKTQILALIPT